MHRKQFVGWWWKLPVAGSIFALGTVVGAMIVGALGTEPVLLGPPPEPAVGLSLLWIAGLATALALAALAAGMAGGRWQRGLLLAAFALVTYGVGTILEVGIFTTLPEPWTLLIVNAAAAVGCALAVGGLFAGPAEESLADRFRAFLGSWPVGGLAWRLGLAFLAFPFFYLLFGMAIAPIVTPLYAEIDFLVVPPMAAILPVLFLRSALFLLVSLPIVVAWQRSRASLALALGLGHFVTVGFAGLVQSTFFPAVLRWTHGLEILADSLCYGAVLAWLLTRPSARIEAAVPRPQET